MRKIRVIFKLPIYLFCTLRDLFLDIVHAVKDRSVVDCLNIAPSVACAASILYGLIQLIRFIVIGGFKIQFGLIKKLGVLGALNEIFTTGTVPDYYHAIFCIAMGVLIVPAFVIAVIEFFRKEKLWWKILTVTVFALGVAGIAASYIIFLILGYSGADIAVGLSFLVGCVLLIGSLVLLAFSEQTGGRFQYTLGIALLAFAITPLILLLIENILGFLIIGTLFAVVRIICPSGSSEGTTYYVPEGSEAVILKDRNGAPCIYARDASGATERLCALDDVRSGIASIVDRKSGRRLF